MRHFDRDFAMTNRLRTEGTDHLLSAGRAVGVKRFVAQSYTELAVRAHRRPGQDRGGSARPDARPARCASRWRRSATSSRRHRRRLDRGDRAPLRRVLWPRHVPDPGRRAVRDGAQAQVPGGRQRRRRVVVRARRGRRRGDRRRASSTASAGSTTSSTTTRPPVAEWLPALAAADRRAQAVARAAVRRPRCSPGEAGVVMMTEMRGASNAKAKRELGWAAPAPELAGGVRGMSERERAAARRAATDCRSRSPTGCSAASPRPRTSSRRRCCASTARSRPASGSSRRARSWRR